MPYMNKIIIIGHVGQAPDLKYTKSGTAYLHFSVATQDEWAPEGKEKKTQWHKVIVWGKRAEGVGKYITKGGLIYVEGPMEYGTYKDKNGDERPTAQINASQVLLLGSRQKEATGEAGAFDEAEDADAPF